MTALIVLGCVLASEPAIAEAKDAMIRLRKIVENVPEKKQEDKENGDSVNDSFDFAEFSEPEEEECVDKGTIPWLLKRCLNNLGVNFHVRHKICIIIKIL